MDTAQTVEPAVAAPEHEDLPVVGVDAHEVDPARREADRILASDPNILETFVRDVQAGGVIGESKNLKVLLLTVVSSVTHDPVSVYVSGASGSGKSTAVKAVLDRCPRGRIIEVDEITPHALSGMGDVRHKVIFMSEASRISRCEDQLRVLISEGRLARVGFREEPTTTGPVGFITTTTGDLESELKSRLIELRPDESESHRREVLGAACRRYQAGAREDDGHRQRVWQEVIAAAGAREVSIPNLESHLPTGLARHHNSPRLLGQIARLIVAHTILHQRQRESVEGRLVATDADIRVGLDLMAEALDVVPDHLKDLARDLECRFGSRPVTAREAAAALARHPDALTKRFNQLTDLGLAVPVRTVRPRTWRILGDGGMSGGVGAADAASVVRKCSGARAALRKPRDKATAYAEAELALSTATQAMA